MSERFIPGSRLLMAAWSLPLLTLGGLLAVQALGPAPDLFATLGPGFLAASSVLGGVLLLLVAKRHRARTAGLQNALDRVGYGDFEPRPLPPENDDLGRLGHAINRMALSVGEHMDAVVREKEKLAAVLDGMWEGVLALGPDCRIQGVNKAMESIVPGIGERLGALPLEVLYDTELQDRCQRMMVENAVEPETMRLYLDDDRRYNVNLVRPAASSGLGLVAVFHDVSEMERLKSMRSDFAANVSHELKTPLTSIKGYAETLLSDTPPPPETARRFMEVILKNADHMGKMISDLLSLSRIESGPQPQAVGPVDAGIALDAAWERLDSMARSRGVDLSLDLPAELPPVLADTERLGQVFRNLLENAIKFGPEGATIRVGAHPNRHAVRFFVRDHGPGIPKAQQARIFERFYSVERHRRNEFGSSGLGLAICRHLVLAFGGEIGVISPPENGQGTEFFFTVPRADPDH